MNSLFLLMRESSTNTISFMNTSYFFSRKYISFLLFICFISINNLYSQELNWTSFSQSIKMTTDTKLKFKLTASVKLVDGDVSSWASIWARVDNKNDEDGFFDNMGDRPVVSSTWATYEINGFIDEYSGSLNFGGICMYNGKFFFDDFKS